MDNLQMQKKDWPYQPETVKPQSSVHVKLLKGIIFTGLLSIFLLSAFHMITNWDYLKIQDIEITGNERISREETLLYAGIREGMNIADINLSVARKRLLINTWVAEAVIDAVFPSEIIIHIKEHQPLALFDMGSWLIVNREGNIFRQSQTPVHLEVPVVRGLKFTDIAAHDAGDSFKAVMDVLQYGQIHESILPSRAIREIRVDREMGLTLMMSDNFHPIPVNEIRLGFGDYPMKYGQLRKLFAYLKENSGIEKIESIDLNNPDRIVVNPGRTESLNGEKKEV